MREIKFVVTKELGKLAKWLRILGYDTVYYSRKNLADLVILALREKRILITRSAALTKYKGIRVVLIKHDRLERQIDQAAREMALSLDEEEMFTRCVECNALLEDCGKDDIKGKVPEYVFETQENFKRCPECAKIFWKGTHWDMVKDWLEKTRAG
ncbi:MAG: Mut7-C RNAse domain-containing protein [Candidatus Omnitrophota bacterium]|nr:Mut7-C RNAse domain-containing protein [Candidatus Omnitrophota bacterium]